MSASTIEQTSPVSRVAVRVHRLPADLANGRLLCGHHHRKRHSPHHDTIRLPGGTVRFHRCT